MRIGKESFNRKQGAGNMSKELVVRIELMLELFFPVKNPEERKMSLPDGPEKIADQK